MSYRIELTPKLLGSFLTDAIAQIDMQCSTLHNGVEYGLCNVKLQFKDQALAETGKKLTEELLIAWLLAKRLKEHGCGVSSEHPYPGTREKCDLVINLPSGDRVWVEVKHAWKHWYNCDGTAGTSINYRGYLFGDASHPGTAHDFDKLERVSAAETEWVGVLLIGFKSKVRPMNTDVQELMTRMQLNNRVWNLSVSKNWFDRRNPEFGIGVWFWIRKVSY